jgi:AraC family transcriptional regulator
MSPLTQTLKFIRTHLSEELSLNALAQHSGFSAYHFARLFRRTLGESPHQYVLRLRVERARLAAAV